MGPDRDQTHDPWICSQTRICSQTPKSPVFSGSLSVSSWQSFTKFDCIETWKRWSDDKKSSSFFDCLSEKALEYAERAEKDNYDKLKKE